MNPSGDSTPLAYKQALETRLRKAAAAASLDINRFRQTLLHDRFIARVARQLGDRAMVKGGVALELRLSRARSTRDLDLHLVGAHDRLLRDLKAAGESGLGDRLSFLVGESSGDEARPPIHESKRYRVEARLAGTLYGSPFGLETTFGELLFGEPEAIEGTRFFEFIELPPTRILVYPREAHLAEKLHAYSLPREAENSRLKDLPDLALLAQTGSFDAAALRTAIERTFGFRATHPVPLKLPVPPASWAVLYQRMAAQDRLPWEDLPSLEKAARAFLDPLLRGQEGSWSPASWSWTRATQP